MSSFRIRKRDEVESLLKEKEISADVVKTDDLCERRVLFGTELKTLRTGRGLTVAEVAEKTRINYEYIEAIERGTFEVLPGRLFGRGFIAALMKHYGAVNTVLTATYDQLWIDDGIQQAISDSTKVRLHEKSSESPFGRLTQQSKFRLVHLVAAAVILLGLTGGSFIAYKKGRPYFARILNKNAEIKVHPVHLDSRTKSDQQGADEQTTVSMTPQATPEKTNSATALPDKKTDSTKAVTLPDPKKKDSAGMPGKQVLTITVVEPVKVKIESDDGKPAIKDLAEGVYSFNFESSADLLIYDAAAVRISFNGNSIGSLGTKGRVRRIGFRSDAPDRKSF